MRLHVKIFEQFSEGSCAQCAESDKLRYQTVFAGSGSETFGPYCEECWNLQVQDRGGVVVDVEQADMSPGRRPPSKKDKKLSVRQERKVAEDIGGRTQPGSGNQAHAKGDIRKKGAHRIEAKFTKAKSFNLTREILDKINSECGFKEKPAVHIEFLSPTTGRVEDEWMVIPYNDWLEMKDAAADNKRPGK